ncbi:hypothetical protein PhCBS80983_g00787 [Powellomyces hirtus]|uniref:ABC1 atypical kinase-like domain-containing protein n=1 Tax=Powellomyces hirtus TaxID=109895 RepID=A0A507EES8_9FUNG|nr:hypothetical protein PhCBS80983_g00787 [Powellomyces hirtus]
MEESHDDKLVSVSQTTPSAELGPAPIPAVQLPSLWSPMTLLRVCYRIITLTLLLTPVVLTFPIWWFFNRGRLETKKGELRTWWVRYLAWSLQRCGGLFIKLGQWMSSRGDLLPPAVCAVLARLQNKVKPHSAAHSKAAISALYNGASIEEIFMEFDDAPVGVGAVAQVHRGILRPTNDRPVDTSTTIASPPLEVAIKVLHPNIHQRISTDLLLVTLFGNFLSMFPAAKYLSIREEVANFTQMMHNQLDLRLEAHNLQVFAKNFKDVPAVEFPTPIEWNERVLVETFHPGLLLREVLDNGPTPYDHMIAQAGVTAFMQMILHDNFFHSDLHPGNILLTFTHTPHPASFAEQAGAWFSTKIDPSPSTRVATQALFQTRTLDPDTLDNLRRAPQDSWTPILSRLKKNGFVPRLVILDAGMVGVLTDDNLRNMKAAFLAGLEFDGERIAELLLTRSRHPEGVRDPDGAKRTLGKIMDDLKIDTGGQLPLSRIHSADIITRVSDLLRTHHISLDGFASLFVCCVLVEGVGRRLHADMDLVQPLSEYL